MLRRYCSFNEKVIHLSGLMCEIFYFLSIFFRLYLSIFLRAYIDLIDGVERASFIVVK